MALLTLAKRSTVALGLLAAGVVLVPWAGAEQQPSPKEISKAEERPAAKTDAERFQGVWIVSQARFSKAVIFGDRQGWTPDADRVAFRGDRMEEDRLPSRDKTFMLRPDRQPKQIEIHMKDVPDGLRRGDVRIGGVYEFVGDELRLVLAETETPPAGLELAPDGPPAAHLTLRRMSDLDQEYARLSGAWTVNRAVEQTPAFHQLNVRGKVFEVAGSPGNPYLHAMATIDPSKSPKQIDLKLGRQWQHFEAGTILKGIYDVDGDDLALAVGLDGGRPANFRANANSAATVFERWGRARKPAAAEKPKEKPAERPVNKYDGGPYKIRLLQEERVKALRIQVAGQFERVKIGKDPLIQYIDASFELCGAELAIADTREAKLTVLEANVERLRFAEGHMQDLQNAGLQTKEGVAQAKAARLKAEIELEKLKAEKPEKP